MKYIAKRVVGAAHFGRCVWPQMMWVVMCASLVAGRAHARQAPATVPLRIGGGADDAVQLERAVAIRFVTPTRIVIVEQHSAPFIRLLTRDGKLVQTLGRMGAGPAEFRYVSAVAIDSAGRVAVFDPALRRVTYFQLKDTLAFAESKATPFQVTAACYLGTQLWAHGDATNDGVMHRLSERGATLTVEQSAGTIKIGHPLDGMRLFRHPVVSGPIACNAVTGEVLAATEGLGLVQVVTALTGASRIEHIIGFEPLLYELAERGGLVTKKNQKFVNDQVVSLIATARSTRVIIGQVGQGSKGNGDYSWTWESELGKASAGPVLRQTTAETDRRGAFALCYSERDYPSVVVVRATRCP